MQKDASAPRLASSMQHWRERIRERVGGYDYIVDSLLANAEMLLTSRGSAGVRGISIQGPSGSGKSHLASVIASVAASEASVEPFDISQAVNGDTKAVRDLRQVLATARIFAQKSEDKSHVRFLVLEKAEALVSYQNHQPLRSNLNRQTVIIEIIVQELRLWRDEALPIVLLMPWASSFNIPAELCGSGVFEGHLLLPTPLSSSQRLAVLLVCAKALPLAEDGDEILKRESEVTGGFLPCDLSALCRAAALVAIAGVAATAGDTAAVCVTRVDFAKARQRIDPAAMRSSNLIVKPHGHTSKLVDETCGLSTLIGQNAAVQSLQTLVVGPFRRLLQEGPLGIINAPVGVLLTGEAGTGKTHLAVQLAVDLKAHIHAAAPADLLASRVGDAEKSVAALFSAARRSAPTVVVLEDIDSIAPANSSDLAGVDCQLGEDNLGIDPESETRAAYVLRSEIDTLHLRRMAHARMCSDGRKFPLASEALVLIVATARNASLVAPWLLRPHRLSCCIHLEPEFCVSDVRQLMQYILQNSGQTLSESILADVSDAICSVGKGRPAIVAAICRAAAVKAIRRAVGFGSRPCIEKDDLLTALGTC